jgi:hypothetical protein
MASVVGPSVRGLFDVTVSKLSGPKTVPRVTALGIDTLAN